MTVENQDNKKRVHGDGVTSSMTFSFRVLSAADLVLYFITNSTGASVEKTVDVDYTVSLEDDGEGGTVTFITIPTALQDALLVNVLELTQTADLPTEGNFNEETVEIALDRSRLIDIQQQEEIDRSVKLAIEDPLNNDAFGGLELPPDSLASRAGKIFGWDDAGSSIQYYAAADIDIALVSSFISTLLDDTSAAEARATLGIDLIPYTAASASGPASLQFAEDTDNGSNKVTLKPPASIAADVDITLPGVAATLATLAGTETLTNKTLTDSSVTFADDGDPTKKLAFQVSGVTAGQTRTVTIPDKSGTMMMTSDNPVKAWVNFNGTGTVAIRASNNVSSITDNGTGDYTVNFTSALTDANYCTNITLSPTYGGTANSVATIATTSGNSEIAPTTSAIRFNTRDGSGNQADFKYINVVVVGN